MKVSVETLNVNLERTGEGRGTENICIGYNHLRGRFQDTLECGSVWVSTGGRSRLGYRGNRRC